MRALSGFWFLVSGFWFEFIPPSPPPSAAPPIRTGSRGSARRWRGQSSPPAYGGSPERAIEIYRKQVDASGPLSPSSPLPDWGRPEALMSLAYAQMIKSSPDLDAATDNARAALKLQPQWHYVRDILMAQIETKRKQAAGAR
jgi:hypothetical protein